MTDTAKQPGSFARLMNLDSGRKKETPPTKEPAVTPKQKPQHTADTRVSVLTCHMTLLQSDIDELRKPAYTSQTFRLHEGDKEWVKDLAYRLSKETPRKVSQTTVVRLSLKLFEKMLAQDREAVKDILQKIT